jgi:hypothetical protein
MKYELIFYQVETCARKHKDVIWQGRTWNEISDWKLEKHKCSGKL